MNDAELNQWEECIDTCDEAIIRFDGDINPESRHRRVSSVKGRLYSLGRLQEAMAAYDEVFMIC